MSALGATRPSAIPTRMPSTWRSIHGPIARQRSTAARPSAGVSIGWYASRLRNWTCGPSIGSTDQLAMWLSATPSSYARLSISACLVTRSAAPRPACWRAVVRFSRPRRRPISRSSAPASFGRSCARNRRSPSAVALSGSAASEPSQASTARSARAWLVGDRVESVIAGSYPRPRLQWMQAPMATPPVRPSAGPMAIRTDVGVNA